MSGCRMSLLNLGHLDEGQSFNILWEGGSITGISLLKYCPAKKEEEKKSLRANSIFSSIKTFSLLRSNVSALVYVYLKVFRTSTKNRRKNCFWCLIFCALLVPSSVRNVFEFRITNLAIAVKDWTKLVSLSSKETIVGNPRLSRVAFFGSTNLFPSVIKNFLLCFFFFFLQR